MSAEEDHLYYLRLSLTDGVGAVNAKKLVAYCGGAREVFERGRKELETIPGIGTYVTQAIFRSEFKEKAQQALEQSAKLGLKIIPYTDSAYPRRLLQCADAPLLLFSRGVTDLNSRYTVSIVGTRYATDYGKEFTDRFVKELKDTGVLIVSGLAHGIDVAAHKAALKHGLPTVGVLAHGLDHVYPAVNRPVAEKMLDQGALLSEFVPGTKADKERFPMRNRIIAGMSDATVVMESDKSGGSMITARMANDYSRDVFALPGRVGDKFSRGTNRLIRTDGAHLLETTDEFKKMMGWEQKPESPVQSSLFVELNEEEKTLVDLLRNEPVPVDIVASKLDWPMSKVSAMLLSLEFKGLVRSLPGKRYVLGSSLVSS